MDRFKGIFLAWRSMMNGFIALITSGLIFFLFSCTEEYSSKPGGYLSNKKVTVHFSIGDVTYNGHEVVTRNYSDMNPETVVVPLDNGLCMVATLEVDQSVKTRAGTSDLGEGTLLRIVAYLDGTNYETHADYEIKDGRLLTANSFMVPEGSYKFVAYSYNSTTKLPAHHPTTISNVDPACDLLWGCYPANGTVMVTTATHNDVAITMEHLFSQLTVMATTKEIGNNINIISMDTVSMIPGKKTNLSIKDTIFTVVSDTVLCFSSAWVGLGTDTTVTSQSRTVYTHNAESFQINFKSVTLAGHAPYTNLTANFFKRLQRGVSYTVKVRFKKKDDIVEQNPANLSLYVGAFWKHDQTGERLIRIERPTTGDPAAADGNWTASVVVGREWIVLDRVWSTPNPAINGNDLGFDATYRVNSILTSVNGILRPSTAPGYQLHDEYIYFRIGLQNTIPSGTNRYGMILLTYKNNTYSHRIWVRQGQGSDVITATTTAQTARWSPYNLSTLGAEVAYPTQAGHFYQWAYPTGGSNVAQHWNPIGSVASWNSVLSSVYALGNVCPSGYRVPSGSQANTSQLETLLQSDVKSDWGYYADGWFDRKHQASGFIAPGDFHAITPTTPSLPENAAVSLNVNDIAYIGKLFYNETNSRSIFFPSSGYREYYQGNMIAPGLAGRYWSSTNDGSGGYAFNLFIMGTSPVVISSNIGSIYPYGFNVRCVEASLSVSPGFIWLSPSAGNSSKTVTVTSKEAWTVISSPANASLSINSGNAGTTAITINRSLTSFGLGSFVIQGNTSGEQVTVYVDNYYIDDTNKFALTNNSGANTASFVVPVYGGNGLYTIGAKDGWITADILPDGKLQLTASGNLGGTAREGSITLAHVSDPSYQVTIPVLQGYDVLPPFEFLVMKFTWGTKDVDIAVEVRNLSHPNPTIPFANEPNTVGAAKAVGYGLISNTYSYTLALNGIVYNSTTPNDPAVPPKVQDNTTLLIWGGDAAGGQGETVLFKAPLVTPADPMSDPTGLPRYIILDAYAGWYVSNGNPGSAITLNISTYAKMYNGALSAMVKPNADDASASPAIYRTNFYNVPASLGSSPSPSAVSTNLNPPVTSVQKSINVNAKVGSQNNDIRSTSTYRPMARITYDRYTNGATILWY